MYTLGSDVAEVEHRDRHHKQRHGWVLPEHYLYAIEAVGGAAVGHGKANDSPEAKRTEAYQDLMRIRRGMSDIDVAPSSCAEHCE